MRAVVVGGGISGAFTADALGARCGSGLQLQVLEREDRCGGRMLRRRISGAQVETGASLFHSSNQLIVDSVGQLGLGCVDVGSSGTVGIWDGSRFVLRTSGRPGRDTLRLLTRYRLPLLRASRDARRLIRRLGQVYPRLEQGESWETPQQLLTDLDLYRPSQSAANDYFPAGRFVEEFLNGASRNNYAQVAEDLNALVEFVSLAGAGLGGGTLMQVTEGNEAVAAGVLHRSGAQLRPSGAVERIERVATGWSVHVRGSEAVEADIVVLAAPLETSQVQLVGVPPPPPRRFVTVHVTFIVGSPRPEAFGGAGAPPDFTLTTAGAGHLLSIERVANTAAGPLHKVFSTQELSDQTVSQLFAGDEVTRMEWLAYPRLPPTSRWPGFRLAPGLYYTGAMEYAVSTMETQAISGVATANLATTDLRR